MAQVTIHDSSMSGITWKAAVGPQVSEHLVMIEITKAGKHGFLLEESRPWDATCKVWRCPRPSGIPKYLWALLTQKLQEFEPRVEVPSPQKPSLPSPLRGSFPGASQSISVGRMSFPSFLAMELVEVHCSESYRRHAAQAH
jgi:hypothetical protein